MRIRCSQCGKPVSTEVPENTIIRAFIECPECIKDRAANDEEYENFLLDSISIATKRRTENERNNR